MCEASGAAAVEVAAATEDAAAPLSELVSDEVGHADSWTLKVYLSFINEYTYKWQDKEVSTKKLIVVLMSTQAREYCLGVARTQKGNYKELQAQQQKFSAGSTWRFSKVRLNKNEKPQYINTSARIAIDLRASQTTMLLQSPEFPKMPEPTTTVADILRLRSQQRFDLLAVPTEVISKRNTGAAQVVADVRLADGSYIDKGGDRVFATIPLTLFFKNEDEFATFNTRVGKQPIFFFCLNGTLANGAVSVGTQKNMSSWKEGTGSRCDEMAAQAAALLQSRPADVAVLAAFTANEQTDYAECLATLTACSILDLRASSGQLLEDDATEHVYQLNHVYVPAPAQTCSVTHDGRLFAVLDCWDFTQKLQLAFRSKAMCSLARQSAEDYASAVAQGELRHPLLASVRVRVKKGGAASDASATEQSRDLRVIAVEAEPVDLAVDDVPNSSVDALHGLLAAGGPPGTERMIAASLADVSPSPFYNLVVQEQPVDKALVLLRFTQKTKGAQQQGSFRIVAENVVDAIAADDAIKVATVARCSVERCPDFVVPKDAVALAVICKATQPTQQQHAAVVYIEAMQIVEPALIDKAKSMVEKLRAVAAARHSGAEPSQESPAQQQKCRRLHRYPTTR